MGFRIEDDILITETGCEVLSEDCPKTVDAIRRTVGARTQPDCEFRRRTDAGGVRTPTVS